MATVVVIGDVGGHPHQLRRALSFVGAYGEDLALPADVIVVQVGDLVDRGPDSRAVLHLVRAYLDRQPGQWVQLVGNHESQYLPGCTPFWADPLDDGDVRLLTSWWELGTMHVATAVRTAEADDLLITHAGLTVDSWRELGEPMTATEAARRLNDRPEPLLWRGGGVRERSAGPLWADAGWELCGPWLEHYSRGGFVPFGQIHGHSAIVRYADQSWRCPGRVRHRATVDWAARHVRVRIGGRVFIGTDPKHGRHGAADWQPLVLPGATILSPTSTAVQAPG
jgi:calcineurin-like phosphoesterase family protein